MEKEITGYDGEAGRITMSVTVDARHGVVCYRAVITAVMSDYDGMSDHEHALDNWYDLSGWESPQSYWWSTCTRKMECFSIGVLQHRLSKICTSAVDKWLVGRDKYIATKKLLESI